MVANERGGVCFALLAAGLSGTVPGSLVGRGWLCAPRVDRRSSVWGLRGPRGPCLCLSRAGPPSSGPVLTRVDLIANVKLLVEAAELYPAPSRPARRQLRGGLRPLCWGGGGGGGESDRHVWVRDRRTDGGITAPSPPSSLSRNTRPLSGGAQGHAHRPPGPAPACLDQELSSL